ncbi:MAG: glyoxalase/bleomycin resistance/dioxygenase family protein [Clostridiales bacterium]|jgi:catechol 2,3-dioxygenase-like lactoylglutathione lyase family enzyme|nr:glyoxalase/bleomycin resistance/dioxygenase family protein [Clostridiales bacterium]
MKLEYILPLIAVKSVDISKKFYSELFGQTVVLDLGKNVTFSGGFAIQEDFAWIAGLPQNPSYEKSYDMELYFEVDDFDEFLDKLKAFPNVEHLHPPKKYDWQQRVIRIFDPDGHIIEIGESMSEIARRYLRDGKTPEETAAIIQHPIEFVLASRDGKL